MKNSSKILKILSSKFSFDKNVRKESRRFLSNDFCNFGNNNKIILVNNGIEYLVEKIEELCDITSFSKTTINILGSNNTLKIHIPTTLHKFTLNCSSDNVNIEIGKECTLRDSNVTIWGGGGICKNTVVKLGDKCSIWKKFELFVSGSSSFIMENDCMISHNVTIWCGDGHQIVNKDNNEIINLQKEPLVIGTHSWISNNVLITKNAKIPPNTIVGMGSVVSKKFIEENTCIAGNPARIVKRNITWSRENNL